MPLKDFKDLFSRKVEESKQNRAEESRSKVEKESLKNRFKSADNSLDKLIDELRNKKNG